MNDDKSLRCKTCRFWSLLEFRGDIAEETYTGQCSAAPPTAETKETALTPQGHKPGYQTIHFYQGYWPATSEDDYCGMHKEFSDE